MVEHDGTRLERLMKRASVNATTLADAMDVSDTAVGKWIETGKIARDRIVGICKVLGCSSDELLGIAEIADEPRSEPVKLFTKERRADDHVVALQLAFESLLKVVLQRTRGSAAEFLAESEENARAYRFSDTQGFLGRAAGIAIEVRDIEAAEAQAPQPADPVKRTKRGK